MTGTSTKRKDKGPITNTETTRVYEREEGELRKVGLVQEEKLSLPEEIPWKLASTTQPLAAGKPDQTSIPLFVFEPCLR
jgi:hypothetical protein